MAAAALEPMMDEECWRWRVRGPQETQLVEVHESESDLASLRAPAGGGGGGVSSIGVGPLLPRCCAAALQMQLCCTSDTLGVCTILSVPRGRRISKGAKSVIVKEKIPPRFPFSPDDRSAATF